MDWFNPASYITTSDKIESDGPKEEGGHETDPSTGSDSDSATQYPTTLRPQFLTGIARDLKRRLIPYYLDDWKLSPPSLTIILNASLSSFVRQLVPALIFAGWLEQQTNGQLSAIEVLLGTSIVGSFYAMVSGQPLVLVGVSGPVALLLGASHSFATTYFQVADFFAFFWWMCIWTGILHVFTACFGLVNLAGLITPFTAQVFELFVSISFLYKSIHDMVVYPFLLEDATSDDERLMAYSSLVIGVLTFSICWKLHSADTWIYFNRHVRGFMASYNMLIAILVATGLSYIPDFSKSVENKDIIKRFDLFSSSSYDWTPSVNRAWLEITPLSGIDTRGIFGALIPGLMLYILFFMEHNMCSAIVQAPKHKLKKPSAYHWDFFVLGLSTIACGFLGLPPCCGVIPQAPMHTRSLCTKRHDANGNEYVLRCEEQRWSALLQAGLMFAALTLSSFLTKVPIGCLFGVLLYLGVDSLSSNAIWTRITLKFVMASERPQIAIVTDVTSWATVQRYTGVQIGLGLIAFGMVYFTDHGYVFPVILAAGVPIRKLFLSCIFRERDLRYLDPLEMSEEEILEEHHEMRHALSPISAAGSDTFQRVHEFHHSNLAYDTDDDFTKSDGAPEQFPSPKTSPRHQQQLPPQHRTIIRVNVDEEHGMQAPVARRNNRMVQSLSKVASRDSSSVNSTPAAPTFMSSWHAWTQMFDTEATAPGEWCGTGMVDDVLHKSAAVDNNNRGGDELSIRKTKSSRSTKTEVFDADDTVRSIRSYHQRSRRATPSLTKTPSGEDTRASNRNRTMRVVAAPSASELFDSDMLSLTTNRTRTGDFAVHERSRSKPKVRGLSEILGGGDNHHHHKPISPKSQRSTSSWRSDRSIRKYSDVEQRIRSNEQLDFDADRAVVPESILKNNNSKSSATPTKSSASGRIAFAPAFIGGGGQTPVVPQVLRQHSEQEEM